MDCAGQRTVEVVKKRAVCMVPGLPSSASYEEKLQILGLPTLREHRERGDMIEVFKIQTDMIMWTQEPGLCYLKNQMGLLPA
jgi:hypothetical protein